MKCREFDEKLMEWVAGRLPEHLAAAMSAHSRSCASCARLEAEERGLRLRWQSLPDPGAPPDLWPRLAARLEQKPARRWQLRLRPVWMTGATLAAAASLTLVVWLRLQTPSTVRVDDPQPTVQQTASGVDEGRVVQMISDMQSLPDPDRDEVLAGSEHYRKDMRILLAGGPGR
jgi:hypothetical protein